MNTKNFKRRLTAILSADVEGYSRLMRDNEDETIRTITTYRTAIAKLVEQYRGRVVDSPGDNILSEFGSSVDAVNCAVEVQRELAERNAELPENRRMQFRIGVNSGDVVEEGERIYGDGVNIAARIEGLAEGGGICISGTVYDSIEGKLGLEFENLGKHEVKNIDKPIRVYRVLSFPGAAAHRVVKAKKAVGKTWRNKMIAISAVLVVGAAVAIWYFCFRLPPIEPASVEKMAYPLPEKPSIAVLPLANISGDPEQEYFSDGMTDTLITDLSKISELFVIARNSVFTYKGKSVKVDQIGRELGVRYVLEGSVQKAGNQVRINAQLIDTTKGGGGHLWADRYDGKMDNIFALQDEIIGKIVSALAVKLIAKPGQVAKKETDNTAAYDAFLKGSAHFLRFTAEDFEKAVRYFKKAIELDPNYGRAYAALARTYMESSHFGWNWNLGMDYCEAILRACEYLGIAMKEPTSIAHQVAATVNWKRYQFEDAVVEAQRAIALDLNDPSSHLSMGTNLTWAGRPEEGLDFIKRAMRLDPLNPARYLLFQGTAHFCMGQLEEAAFLFDGVNAHDPGLVVDAGLLVAATYALLDRDQDARTILPKYKNRHVITSWQLREAMPRWPIKDREAADRLANGLLKAGLFGQPSGYYKIYEENKLTGEEINDLLYGVTVGGSGWTVHNTKDGLARIDVTWGEGDDFWVSGKKWIEGEMQCTQWQKRVGRLLGGLKICGPVYRNPEGTPENKDEFLQIIECAIFPFSPLE